MASTSSRHQGAWRATTSDEPLLGVHDPAGDRGDGVRAGEPPAAGAALGGQAQVGADQPRKLHRIARVEHGERRIDAHERPVAPQEPVAHGVERAAPHPFGARPDAPEHLGRGPAAEREQADPLGGDAAVEQVLDPGRQHAGLAAPGAREHQQGPVAVGGRVSLGRVEVEHAFPR